MIDHASVEKWLQDYVAAWKNYNASAIGALFSDDATYKFHPFDKNVVTGRDAIVATWLKNRDKQGTYDAEYHVVAVDGNTAVSNGRSRYFKADAKTMIKQFDNVFILKFDDEGRCTEFSEWYVEPRK